MTSGFRSGRPRDSSAFQATRSTIMVANVAIRSSGPTSGGAERDMEKAPSFLSLSMARMDLKDGIVPADSAWIRSSRVKEFVDG